MKLYKITCKFGPTVHKWRVWAISEHEAISLFQKNKGYLGYRYLGITELSTVKDGIRC